VERHVLRETLEAASKNDSKRSAIQQKIGDYWAACMDENGIEAAGMTPLKPELDRIAGLKSKQEITLEIAHLHHVFPGAWRRTTIRRRHPFSASAADKIMMTLPKCRADRSGRP